MSKLSLKNSPSQCGQELNTQRQIHGDGVGYLSGLRYLLVTGNSLNLQHRSGFNECNKVHREIEVHYRDANYMKVNTNCYMNVNMASDLLTSGKCNSHCLPPIARDDGKVDSKKAQDNNKTQLCSLHVSEMNANKKSRCSSLRNINIRNNCSKNLLKPEFRKCDSPSVPKVKIPKHFRMICEGDLMKYDRPGSSIQNRTDSPLLKIQSMTFSNAANKHGKKYTSTRQSPRDSLIKTELMISPLNVSFSHVVGDDRVCYFMGDGIDKIYSTDEVKKTKNDSQKQTEDITTEERTPLGTSKQRDGQLDKSSCRVNAGLANSSRRYVQGQDIIDANPHCQKTKSSLLFNNGNIHKKIQQLNSEDMPLQERSSIFSSHPNNPYQKITQFESGLSSETTCHLINFQNRENKKIQKIETGHLHSKETSSTSDNHHSKVNQKTQKLECEHRYFPKTNSHSTIQHSNDSEKIQKLTSEHLHSQKTNSYSIIQNSNDNEKIKRLQTEDLHSQDANSLLITHFSKVDLKAKKLETPHEHFQELNFPSAKPLSNNFQKTQNLETVQLNSKEINSFSASHHNITDQKLQKFDINKSLNSQTNCNKQVKETKSVNVICKKKPTQNICRFTKDTWNDRVKQSSENKKAAPVKTCKSSLDGNKVSQKEDINVAKLINAISFQRWNNNVQPCESDCRLLAERVRLPMGTQFTQSQEEKQRKQLEKCFNNKKQPKNCISLLIERYKRKRKKGPALFSSKRKRKSKKNTSAKKGKTARTRDKTVSQTNNLWKI